MTAAPNDGLSATPVILLVVDAAREILEDEFRSRYDREYTVLVTQDAATARVAVSQIMADGVPVAMIAAEGSLPGILGADLLAELHATAPTARRVCLLGWEGFASLDTMRVALAEGKFDTFVGIPRGKRDEEFHTAIIELLSDWGWSVASPVIAAVTVVADAESPLLGAIMDFLDRMGMPTAVYPPGAPQAQPVLGTVAGDIAFPAVAVMNKAPLVQPTVSELGAQIYGSPDDIPDGTVTDLLVVGAGPAGLAAAVYAASEGLTTIVIEEDAVGGQAGTSSMIRNYLGFPRGISGMRLTQRARMQASRFGAAVLLGSRGDEHRAVRGPSPRLRRCDADLRMDRGRRDRGGLPSPRGSGDRGPRRRRRLLRSSDERLAGDAGPRRGRRRGRQLGRSGCGAPDAVRPVRHHGHPACVDHRDDVGLPRPRDRWNAAHHRAHPHGGPGRRRQRAPELAVPAQRRHERSRAVRGPPRSRWPMPTCRASVARGHGGSSLTREHQIQIAGLSSRSSSGVRPGTG